MSEKLNDGWILVTGDDSEQIMVFESTMYDGTNNDYFSVFMIPTQTRRMLVFYMCRVMDDLSEVIANILEREANYGGVVVGDVLGIELSKTGDGLMAVRDRVETDAVEFVVMFLCAHGMM